MRAFELYKLQAELRRQFFLGIRKSLRKAVIAEKPRDFDAAVSVALDLESYDILEGPENKGGIFYGEEERPQGGNRSGFKRNGNRDTSYRNNDSQPRKYDMSTVKCYKCNRLGHFRRECWSKSKFNDRPNLQAVQIEKLPDGKNRNQPSGRKQGGNNYQKRDGPRPQKGGCFKCGLVGHFKRVSQQGSEYR